MTSLEKESILDFPGRPNLNHKFLRLETAARKLSLKRAAGGKLEDCWCLDLDRPCVRARESTLGTLGHLQPMSERKWTSGLQLHGNESRPHLHKQEKGFLCTEIKSVFRHLCLSHRRPVSDSWLTKSENNSVMLFEATKIMAICHSRLEHGRILETCGTHYLIHLLAFGKGEGRIEFFGRASGTWNLNWFCRLEEFDQDRRRHCVPFLGKFREQLKSGL